MMMGTHQIQCHLFNVLLMRDIEPDCKKDIKNLEDLFWGETQT